MTLDILGQTWNISQKGEDLITENNTIKDKATILKNALNSDLKEIGSPILAKIQNKNNVTQVVLQIQKVRNISAPKANENSHVAPRMLKLVLTDGDSYIQAVETASISSLSVEKTPPGAKILIQSAKICSGFVLLDSSNCSLLGGRVPALYEKWELAKSVQHHNRQNTSSDGPPAWVNFGCKVQADVQDKSFKSLDNKSQEKENTKFELQRQDAIAEATSGAIKKVFGGGAKQPFQPPPPKFKRQNDIPNKEKKNYKSKFCDEKDVEDKLQKPSERVSLFDFLEDKLLQNETSNVTQIEAKPVVNNYPKSVQTYHMSQNRNTYQNRRPAADQDNFFKPRNDPNSQTQIKIGPRNELNFQTQNKTGPRNEVNLQTQNKIGPRNELISQTQNTISPRNEFNPQTQNKIERNGDVNGLSNNFEKMSLNTQFASRSLKQHLNLGPQKKNSVENANNMVWKVGDDCVAKYWEDGKFYNATITAITEKTCVVKFKGYGNFEEVLKVDCLPATNDASRKSHYTGPMEFRRSARTFRRQ